MAAAQVQTKTISGTVTETAAKVKGYVAALSMRSYVRVCQMKKSALETAAKPQVQIAAAGAAAGAGNFGTAGGAVGVVTGGVVGAAVGVVPAVFTFGLSIPIGAAIGATVGGGAGVSVGCTTGLAAGGAAGYYGYENKDNIKAGYQKATNTVTDSIEGLRTKASSSIHCITSKVKSVFVRNEALA
jgi:hypothetical protein